MTISYIIITLMLDFVFTFLIFLEIILTFYCVKYIIQFEKKIIIINNKLNELYKIILLENEKIKKTLTNINKFISFIRNKKFLMIRKIIKITIEITQLIIIIKSFNYKKGFEFNFKNIKKVLFMQLAKLFIKKIFIKIQANCQS